MCSLSRDPPDDIDGDDLKVFSRDDLELWDRGVLERPPEPRRAPAPAAVGEILLFGDDRSGHGYVAIPADGGMPISDCRLSLARSCRACVVMALEGLANHCRFAGRPVEGTVLVFKDGVRQAELDLAAMQEGQPMNDASPAPCRHCGQSSFCAPLNGGLCAACGERAAAVKARIAEHLANPPSEPDFRGARNDSVQYPRRRA
jgi:hypothetical protein